MAVDKVTDNDPDKGKEFIQFEDCDRDENCRFRDTNGKCIFETCIVDNELPPAQPLWFFKCIACQEIDTIKPNDMKIHLCANCISRLQKGETLPFICIICGRSQSHPAKGWSTPICDKCLSRLKKYIDMWHCEHCG